jgi:hypothetical protein
VRIESNDHANDERTRSSLELQSRPQQYTGVSRARAASRGRGGETERSAEVLTERSAHPHEGVRERSGACVVRAYTVEYCVSLPPPRLRCATMRIFSHGTGTGHGTCHGPAQRKENRYLEVEKSGFLHSGHGHGPTTTCNRLEISVIHRGHTNGIGQRGELGKRTHTDSIFQKPSSFIARLVKTKHRCPNAPRLASSATHVK